MGSAWIQVNPNPARGTRGDAVFYVERWPGRCGRRWFALIRQALAADEYWVMAMTTDPASATPNPAAPVRPGGGQAQAGAAAKATPAAAASGDSVQLSPEAQAEVTKLKARDADVHAHEEAHMAAGGSLITGGPTYEYQKGPDGKSYAVGGDVAIDASAVAGSPQATIAKARQVVAAALAPADPSGQDESVASQAEAMAASAQAELAKAGAQGSGAGAKVASRPGSLLDVTG
jgi:hypothetical protein